jgi:DNA anti-recombination protein RmuC
MEYIILTLLIIIIAFIIHFFLIKNLNQEKLKILEELKVAQGREALTIQNYNELVSQFEAKTASIARLEAELKFKQNLEIEKSLLEAKLDSANREMIKMQEKLSSQAKLESDLKQLLETAKLEITNQNRDQYRKIYEQLAKYTEDRSKEMTKEASDAFSKIMEKDVKETIIKIQENLTLQQEKLLSHQKPIEFFTKILTGSKEAGNHGEQTIANQLDTMGLRYGIDYFTQVAGKGNTEERLIADIVILIPNSGKKDVLIIDSKSSTKLGSSTSEFMASVESSINTFARKDYKSAVEKRVKEFLPNVEINHTHLFIYLPFDRMLSRISEEKPELLKKVREKDVGILTPVILDFLLDTIKLYSAKIELNERAEEMMEEVKELIKRTGVVLEFVKDLGKSIDLSAKKYQALKASVQGRFVPIVNRMAKPLNVKQVIFDDLNEEGLKQIETKD